MTATERDEQLVSETGLAGPTETHHEITQVSNLHLGQTTHLRVTAANVFFMHDNLVEGSAHKRFGSEYVYVDVDPDQAKNPNTDPN
jgi:hypothetical protein